MYSAITCFVLHPCVNLAYNSCFLFLVSCFLLLVSCLILDSTFIWKLKWIEERNFALPSKAKIATATWTSKILLGRMPFVTFLLNLSIASLVFVGAGRITSQLLRLLTSSQIISTKYLVSLVDLVHPYFHRLFPLTQWRMGFQTRL